MQQSGLPRIVEAEEEKLGVLVQEAQRGQDVPDCATGPTSAYILGGRKGEIELKNNIHQLIIHILEKRFESF